MTVSCPQMFTSKSATTPVEENRGCTKTHVPPRPSVALTCARVRPIQRQLVNTAFLQLPNPSTRKPVSVVVDGPWNLQWSKYTNPTSKFTAVPMVKADDPLPTALPKTQFLNSRMCVGVGVDPSCI